MIRRLTTYNLQLILRLTILLLFGVGLQAAFGCATHDGCAYHPKVRVDRCHIGELQTKTQLCCQSEACHSNAPRQRDLGGPSYQVNQEASHFLLHESQTQTPQLKVGAPFIHIFNPQSTVSCTINPPETPLQSLANLQTVVLLN